MSSISWRQLQGVLHYVGKITSWAAALMLLPLLTAAVYSEWDMFINFALAIGIGLTLGFALQWLPKPQHNLSWLEGMTTVTLSWFVMVVIAAIPLYLSGFYLSYLDALFDAMSGYTTTGLSLVNNLDHLPYSVNMWRQEMCFIGGQGIIVLVMTFFLANSPGSLKIYIGEGKTDKIFPNIAHTARAIWWISILFLFIGSFSLGLIGWLEGMAMDRALLHGMWVFMAAWSVAGFAPQSQSILYYHSAAFELVTLTFMILGSVNFALHYQVFTGKPKEIWQNIESRAYAFSMMFFLILMYIGFIMVGAYSDTWSLFRKGFFQLVTTHTGTGYSTLNIADFLEGNGGLLLFASLIAMLFGGMTGSTAGGIKMLRISILGKGIVQDIKRLFYPESAVVFSKFHFFREIALTDQHVRSAMTISALYLLTFIFGTGLTAAYGYSFTASIFEAASVSTNTGLSVGVTNPAMPTGLKWAYILIMYVARVEFFSFFALIAVIMSSATKKARLRNIG